MNEFIQTAVAAYAAMTKEYPVIGLTVTAGIMAWVTMTLKGTPPKIWNWCKRQATTSVEIHNEDVGTNQRSFDSFCGWLFSQPSFKMSRMLLLNGGWRETTSRRNGAYVNYENYSYLGPGDGFHAFWFEGRLYWAYMTSTREGAISQIKRTIVIHTLGRKHAPIQRLVDSFIYKRRPETIAFYTMQPGGEWNMSGEINPRPLESVAVNGNVREDILKRVATFEGKRDWYMKKGISYKLAFLFHGPTGTGKTSLVRALASELKRSIYQLNLNRVTDESLIKALTNVSPGSIILVEDFDSATILKARRGIQKDQAPVAPGMDNLPAGDPSVAEPLSNDSETAAEAISAAVNAMAPLTLSGVLNAFDGVVGLDGCLIMFTTNVVQQIDEAMRRPGRIDESYLLDHLSHESVCRYVNYMAPDTVWQPVPAFARISGAELQAHLLRHLDDEQAFVDAIPRVTPTLHLEPAPQLETVAA